MKHLKVTVAIILVLILSLAGMPLAASSAAQKKVATPTASKSSGTYSSSIKVKLSCKTSGATIRYTTNGKAPTKQSKKYTGAITISKNKTLRYKAYKTGYSPSSAGKRNYKIRAKIPVANKKSGTYIGNISVTLTSKTKGAKIYYTTDGSTPNKNSKKVSSGGKVTIKKTCDLKVKTYASGYTASKVKTYKYKVEQPSVEDIKITSVYYTNNPNGTRKYCDINYRIDFKNCLNSNIDITEDLWTTDFVYNDGNHVFSKTRTVFGPGVMAGKTRVYCINYGSDDNYMSTKYKISCLGKSATTSLAFRAGSFEPGGSYNTD